MNNFTFLKMKIVTYIKKKNNIKNDKNLAMPQTKTQQNCSTKFFLAETFRGTPITIIVKKNQSSIPDPMQACQFKIYKKEKSGIVKRTQRDLTLLVVKYG